MLTTKIKLCSLGVTRPSNGKPSNRIIRIESNRNIPSSTSCTCMSHSRDERNMDGYRLHDTSLEHTTKKPRPYAMPNGMRHLPLDHEQGQARNQTRAINACGRTFRVTHKNENEDIVAALPTTALMHAKEQHNIQQRTNPKHAHIIKKRFKVVVQHFGDCARCCRSTP